MTAGLADSLLASHSVHATSMTNMPITHFRAILFYMQSVFGIKKLLIVFWTSDLCWQNFKMEPYISHYICIIWVVAMMYSRSLFFLLHLDCARQQRTVFYLLLFFYKHPVVWLHLSLIGKFRNVNQQYRYTWNLNVNFSILKMHKKSLIYILSPVIESWGARKSISK